MLFEGASEILGNWLQVALVDTMYETAAGSHPRATVDDLDAQALSHVLNFLDPKSCCMLACVRTAWRELVDTSPCWQELASERYPPLKPCSSP